MKDCISAISTARGTGGVGIIRLSGENSVEIAEKMFKGKIKVANFEPYKLYVGQIDAGDFFDFGMCVYFKGPKSYTGEDMVEFHCHGGIAITEGILKQTFKLGARPATNGEFTKRAFLNGKLSLSSCEGLIDMINGETQMEAKCGFYLYRERLLNNIIAQQDVLTNILAQINVDIDYPEEDVPNADSSLILQRLNEVLTNLENLSATFENASKVKNGVKVAIVGKPNAGKSSLLNALLGSDKAIVTSIEGTTRDVVEGSIEINGVKFTLFDTAGIRESSDEVEKIGIERSLKAIENADISVHLIDAKNGFDLQDEVIAKKIEKFNHITVLNKNDIADIEGDFDLKISAKENYNISAFKGLLFDKAHLQTIGFDGDFITEERHYYAICDAINYIKSAINNVNFMPLDVITIDIREAWHKLGLISGSTCDSAVIDEIFAKFCVGK